MSEEINSADDFLLKIDQEVRARQAAELAVIENRKQRALRMFDEAAEIIDKYLNALGKRHFGSDGFEIKHTFEEFSGAYWTVYSVEKKDWNTEMRYSGELNDINLHEYRYKEGFKVDLVYSSEHDQEILNLFYDGTFKPFSEGVLKDCIYKIHLIGPRELWGFY